ncbi:ubiquitin carboxyl-terminal hydrolase 8-like isoform X2 [Anneissia japonica]|uniref:ubiquitin carboxyl-terminal hydrolase 8-like isoform X2 n=1 Tax=Anneissia japonica TaxID=1529436 RepID=UPI001425AD0C|nr:ubiquitin carboxyl-terminal hydrolase 8-like isoform X2 [Anneissia japonica]
MRVSDSRPLGVKEFAVSATVVHSSSALVYKSNYITLLINEVNDIICNVMILSIFEFRCTVAVIENGLPPESRHLWSKRGSVDYIILLNWDEAPKSSLDSLKDALYKWDSTVTLKREPLKLEGGYDDWLLRYPMFTTNAKVTAPVMDGSSSLKSTANLLNFDFPSLEDEEPKQPQPSVNGQSHMNGVDTVNNGLNDRPIPAFDRSSKPKPTNKSKVNGSEPPKPIVSSTESKPLQPISSNGTTRFDGNLPPVSGAGDVLEGSAAEVKKTESASSQETKSSMPQFNRALKPSLGTTEPIEDKKPISNLTVDITDIKPPEYKEPETIDRKPEVAEVDEVMQTQEDKLKLHKDKEKRARMDLEKLRNSKISSENIEQKKKLEAMEEQLNAMLQQMEKDRIQMEAERKQIEEKSKALENERKMLKENERKLLEEMKAKENAQRFINPQLPPNWEKRYDEKSKKYYYINHNTKTTCWEPPGTKLKPSSVPQYIPAKVSSLEKPTPKKPNVQDQFSPSKAPLQDKPTLSSLPQQDKPTSTKAPLKDQPKPKLSQSMSSPNIAQMVLNEESKSVDVPAFDRSIKPLSTTRIQDSNKIMKSNRNLAATYGGMGPGLTGLRNLGNTCFMNSVVQCLSNTKYLTDYFVSNIYQRDINRENVLGRKGEVAEDYAVVVRALWCGQYRAISPRDLSNTVIKYVPQFNQNIGHHHDSQEFLIFLMDGLHEDLNRVKKREYIEEKDNKLPDNKAAQIAWDNYKRLNQSICVELFQGQYKSTVQCETCLNIMVKFDTFMYLSLPIPKSNKCSLTDCLDHFSKPEKLTGDNAVKCTRCRVKRNSIKTITIWRTPPVLIIHLKRFYFEGRWRQKLQTNIDFPLTGLDLIPHTVGPKVNCSYFLYGVSSHTGGLDGGHYTAMCKNPRTKKWYKYDDHEVYDISSSRAKQGSAAYILFYSSKNW